MTGENFRAAGIFLRRERRKQRVRQMKDKWRERLGRIREKLWFLRLDEDLDIDGEIQIEETSLPSGDSYDEELPGSGLREMLAKSRRWLLRKRVIAVLLVACIAGGFAVYNNVHEFQDYVITSSIDNEVSAGTQYKAAGKNLYRYNTDGISCVTRDNEVKWSITYNMQAPVADICGNTMAVAEQQGNQIYIVDKDGLVGSFETLLPILKIRVSKQGVVAAVLQEDDITWINMYQPDGTSIMSDKTTISDSGYPVDIDVSPDGQKLVVSYLKTDKGIITSDIVFYHFGAAGQSQDDHIVAQESFEETVIPEVYFTGNSRAVAVSDRGYVVYRGSNAPKKAASVEFEEEIISCFHDEDRIGFLFRGSTEEYNYRMELYDYRGKRKAARDINAEFDEIKIENGQILMYSDSGCDIFTSSGRKRFSATYEKEITEVFYFSEFRRYLIVTRNSFDKIRIS